MTEAKRKLMTIQAEYLAWVGRSGKRLDRAFNAGAKAHAYRAVLIGIWFERWQARKQAAYAAALQAACRDEMMARG